MKRLFVFSALAVAAVAAQAQGLSEEELKFIQEQEKLQREQMLLKMQVQVLEQKAKVAELQRKIDGVAPPSGPQASPLPMPGMVPGGVPGLMPVPIVQGGSPGAPKPGAGVAPHRSLDAPGEEFGAESFQLMSVFGKDGNLQAEVLFNGTRIRVKPGDSLGTGWVVASISPTKLELTKGKQRRTLTF